MASNTPERAPPVTANMSVRRSFTLPPRIQPATRPSPTSTNNADGIETLFICASTKIVSFTASAASRRPSPVRRSNNPDDKPRLIPWKSPTERTLAVGVLRIYRVTASNVSFLNSGNLLHTIFPKSQCWCVDGESTFVLRIRQDSYYRMELPFQTDEDKGTVEQFQAVLGQVLQYERTPCPFKRGFEVELPERPKTPPPRRRPKTQPEKAKKWLFDKTWVPEDGPRPSTPVLEGSDSGTTSSYEEDDRSSINTDRSETVPESPGTVLDITPPRAPPMPSVSERAKLFQKRAVTAPVDLDAVAAKSCAEPEQSKEEERQETSEEKPPTERQVSSDTLSTISTTDSFYSMDTAAQGTPSPPYLDAEDETLNPWAEEHSPQEQEEPRGRGRHRRQISDITVKSPSVGKAEFAPPVTPTTTTPTIDVHPSSAPSTPPLLVSDSDDEDSFEPPFMDVPTPPAAIRMRKLTGASQRRAFSPMPHPHNIFFPPRTHQRGPFTAVLIRKTCELVLGPPAHLVSLMLHIAARISNGFGFGTYRVRHTDEKIPCSWESSDDDWAEEDDFGIPLHNLDDSRIRKRDPASVELD